MTSQIEGQVFQIVMPKRDSAYGYSLDKKLLEKILLHPGVVDKKVKKINYNKICYA